MPWHRHHLRLRARPRGAHLITDEVVAALPSLARIRVGLCHLFLQHTSAALILTENADPTVRADLGRWLDRLVPDGAAYFQHTDEGDDDMPAHAKAAMLGGGLAIPVEDGRLALGTWQGICLVECRDHGGERRIVATLTGDGPSD